MSDQQNTEHLFTISAPTQVPTFELYGKVFHAGAATGGELDLVASLKTSSKGIESVRQQCATLTKFLAGREVKRSEDDQGWVGVEERLSDDWVWNTLPTDKMIELAEQLKTVFDEQFSQVGNRAQRRSGKNSAKA